jgi:hypothetical protein
LYLVEENKESVIASVVEEASVHLNDAATPLKSNLTLPARGGGGGGHCDSCRRNDVTASRVGGCIPATTDNVPTLPAIAVQPGVVGCPVESIKEITRRADFEKGDSGDSEIEEEAF